MQPSPFVVAHNTTGLGTLSRFICARSIYGSSTPLRMPYLNPLACNVSSTDPLGNLSSPATYLLHPSRRIVSSLGLQSNGMPPDPYGHGARPRCPPHCTYSLGAYPPTPALPSLSPGITCWPYARPSLNGSYWATPSTSGLARGCLHQRILLPQGTSIGPYECLSIAAAILLPKGWIRLVPCPPRDASHTPP